MHENQHTYIIWYCHTRTLNKQLQLCNASYAHTQLMTYFSKKMIPRLHDTKWHTCQIFIHSDIRSKRVTELSIRAYNSGKHHSSGEAGGLMLMNRGENFDLSAADREQRCSLGGHLLDASCAWSLQILRVHALLQIRRRRGESGE
jgi:hypothetical protein